MPKISILMPVFNADKYIESSIKSVLNQTFKDFELIIVDDGSKDSTVEVIQTFKDSRIKLFLNGENKGLPYTRNRLLSLATGDYIALFDADDLCNKKRLEIQSKFLDNNDDIMVVGSNFFAFGNKKIRRANVITDPEEIDLRLMFVNCLQNSSVMFRKSFILEHNISYNKDCIVAQDYDFWIECSRYGKITNINKCLIKYRTGHENITKKSKREMGDKRKNIILNIHKKALKYNNIHLSDSDSIFYNNVLCDYSFIKNENQLMEFKCILEKIMKQCKKEKLNKVIQYVWINSIIGSQLKFKEKIYFIFKYRFYHWSTTDFRMFGKLIKL